jgi:hypothetical protein
MLTGKQPFPGHSNGEIWDKQSRAAPPVPSGWTQPVCDVMQRALEKNPAQRFPSCTDFIDALERARQHGSISFRPPTPPESPERSPSPGLSRVKGPPGPDSTDQAEAFPSHRGVPGPKPASISPRGLVPTLVLALSVCLIIAGLRSQPNNPLVIWGAAGRVPPSGSLIDPGSIHVAALRLFDSSADSRISQTEFHGSRYRAIRWEVMLTYPEMRANQQVGLKAVLRSAGGVVLANATTSLVLPVGSATAATSGEISVTRPLAPGGYQLQVSAGESELDQHFQVVAEKPPPPIYPQIDE